MQEPELTTQYLGRATHVLRKAKITEIWNLSRIQVWYTLSHYRC